MDSSKEESLHDKLVNDIFPKCAERLKEEGMISASYVDTKQFEIFPLRHSDSIKIRPDLVLCLPDKRRFAVEVAKSPKAQEISWRVDLPSFSGFF